MQADDVVDPEPRWAAITVLVLLFSLFLLLPGHYRILPQWVAWVAVIAALGSMLAVTVRPDSVGFHRIETGVVFVIVAVACAVNVVTLGRLIDDMVSRTHYDAVMLLQSAVAIWALNVAIFALLYWQADRGQRELRPGAWSSGRDFAFAETEGDGGENWQPTFVDYLFLAFVTSTSFTPPDSSRPSSRRSKLALMLQATISLVTLVVIASRAIATLS
jgi:hypothetical protein